MYDVRSRVKWLQRSASFELDLQAAKRATCNDVLGLSPTMKGLQSFLDRLELRAAQMLETSLPEIQPQMEQQFKQNRAKRHPIGLHKKTWYNETVIETRIDGETVVPSKPVSMPSSVNCKFESSYLDGFRADKITMKDESELETCSEMDLIKEQEMKGKCMSTDPLTKRNEGGFRLEGDSIQDNLNDQRCVDVLGFKNVVTENIPSGPLPSTQRIDPKQDDTESMNSENIGFGDSVDESDHILGIKNVTPIDDSKNKSSEHTLSHDENELNDDDVVQREDADENDDANDDADDSNNNDDDDDNIDDINDSGSHETNLETRTCQNDDTRIQKNSDAVLTNDDDCLKETDHKEMPKCAKGEMFHGISFIDDRNQVDLGHKDGKNMGYNEQNETEDIIEHSSNITASVRASVDMKISADHVSNLANTWRREQHFPRATMACSSSESDTESDEDDQSEATDRSLLMRPLASESRISRWSPRTCETNRLVAIRRFHFENVAFKQEGIPKWQMMQSNFESNLPAEPSNELDSNPQVESFNESNAKDNCTEINTVQAQTTPENTLGLNDASANDSSISTKPQEATDLPQEQEDSSVDEQVKEEPEILSPLADTLRRQEGNPESRPTNIDWSLHLSYIWAVLLAIIAIIRALVFLIRRFATWQANKEI